MATKDIRDIAGYYWAPVLYRYHEDELHKSSVLDWEWLGRMHRNGLLGSGLFKLHLRPIASLTDGEIMHIGSILDIKVPSVVRESWGTYASSGDPDRSWEKYLIEPDTAYVTTGDGEDGSPYERHKPYEICAYLQSIGVYVPGTIDEQYVQLV